MSQIKDESFLIEQICSGQIELYRTLVEDYEGIIRSYCSQMLGNLQDGEDAAQEAFIKAFQGLTKFRKDSKFSTWLTRIAHNVCIDFLRRKRVRRMFNFPMQQAGSKEETLDALGLATDMTQAVSIEKRLSDREILQLILAGLPEQERAAILLREVNGFSYEEAASALNTTVEAVRSRISRARKKAKEIAQLYLRQADDYIGVEHERL